MKKIICIVLILSLLFCFTACQNEPTLEEQLIGQWTIEFDLSENIADSFSTSMGMDLSKYSDQISFNLIMNLDFAKDKTVNFTIDEEAYESAMTSLISEICDIMTEETYELLESQGASKDDAEALFESSYGCGVKEYYEKMFAQQELPELVDANKSGTYKLDGNKLYIAMEGEEFDEEYATISIKNDKLTLDGEVESSILASMEEYGVQPPWTLTKKN